MGEYWIRGGRRLQGELRVSGAKNAVLPIFAATVLNGGESVIHNCPLIRDTYNSIAILEYLGCTVKVEGNTVVVNSAGIHTWKMPDKMVEEMRSSVIFMGGMLGRFGKIDISHPGGCKLGLRPIDLHQKALRDMCAEIVVEQGGYMRCRTDRLQGTRISLDFASVGATENIMLAAVLAEGETIISNAAREPEIVDLQRFLNGMGADIQGAGTDLIVINGVKKLHAVEHRVIPDRVVAGTYLLAGAVTGGEIKLIDAEPKDLIPVTAKLVEMGCEIDEKNNGISLKAPNRLKSVSMLLTQPHPGFPTDLQAPFVAALSIADGTSVVHETIFDSRVQHISELRRMGADITSMGDARTFIPRGVEKLHGATVTATDLRAGAALILAGLSASGDTVVQESKHVERGYECIEEALQNIGADITKIS